MHKNSLRVISFGEVLYDVFPDKACLGGAPLNLAVHLHRQGADVKLISAVGDDDLGLLARDGILEQGLSDEFVFKVPQATGRVTVMLDEDKVPSYVFSADCAYDHIPFPESLELKADLFCFGSLAQRGEESRRNLWRILDRVDARIFCDVNLRQNFFSREILERSLSVADLVKLNDEELPVIAEMFGITASCEAVAKRFGIETIIQTLGPEGCEVWHDGETVTVPAAPAKVVSTVGAGDSFSAAFIYHYLSGKSIRDSAVEGNLLAARVAEQPGAF